MEAEALAVDPLAFYLTGGQPGGALAGQSPALFAAYRDLAALRYDFPLILTADAGAPVKSLSGIIDELLQKIAPGNDGESLRRAVLMIERDIRKASAAGATGMLSELWDKAAARHGKTDEASAARAALDLDGLVLDCREETAEILIAHLWTAVEAEKARSFHAASARLIAKLTDILRADHLRSPAGRSAESLKAMIGPKHHALFDFEVLSSLLPKSSPRDALPESRRRRIEWALAALEKQRFFPASAEGNGGTEPYAFRFDSCGEALAAYRARLPEMVELVKAKAIAELEIEGAYVEGRHDAFFSGFDAASLSAEDRALFPDYLLVLGGGSVPFDNTGLLAVLSSAIPLKILVNVGDLVAGTPAGDDPAALGVRSVQLAQLVAGLGNVYVVQSAASNLYQLRERLMRGLEFTGPALFSVYTGAPGEDLPPYLAAAAAMQSRAFPAFSYDPGAGPDLASRYALESDPEPDADWTTAVLEYADPEMQRVRQDVAFTFVDFLLCDPRYRHHFAVSPPGFDSVHLVPAAEWIEKETADGVPYVLSAGADNAIVRLIADERAVRAAHQCLENWRRLRDLARSRWSRAEPEPAASQESAPAAPPPAAAPAAEAPERASDEAYIETARCSSCNECTQVNNRMFAYNADKQAFIADIKAGTYAQLVEAAENCQLGVIHPGKPVNPSEPGLDELLKRAEPFL